MLELNVNKIFVTIFITVLSLLISSAATNQPGIRSYKILEGDNLLVICNVTIQTPDVDVYWTKNDTSHYFMRKGKRLEILNIKRNYSGDYLCHTLNTSFSVQDRDYEEDKIVQVINVDVQYPAEIKNFNVEPYEVIEDDTFTIICDFQGNPPPVWSIFNREKGYGMKSAIGPNNSTQVSPEVTCDYSGYWECTGKNMLNYGVNVTRGHNITVYCAPKPLTGGYNYIIVGTVGEPVQLNMSAKANPHATYTWSKDDGTDISNITIQDTDLDDTNLTFPLFSVPLFGNYTLKMSNAIGTNYAHYQILADGKPETPTQLQISDVTSDSVTLQWTSGFDMGSRQHFIVMELSGNQYIQFSDKVYNNYTNHGINQTWTYVLDKLSSDTSYNMTVVAVNEHAFISALADPSVAFRTKSNPTSSKTNVTLILGLTFGTIGTLGMIAFIVYVVKFKRLRSSYGTMNSVY
ncbi:nephrin-like [Ruditapes philippinarum]|uniref:nephrin-like n=1 Tax=Ruditapes philippinarum TaxID=129788 RepID=UPI00295B50CF|nr:nephrin-like [Ruditapes philippinarum]